MNSKPVSSSLWREYALGISQKLDLYGAWFFQLKEDRNGTLKLLEVAPRIAGTMATHRVIGINFPLLSIYEAQNIDISILINSSDVEIDRALCNGFKHSIEYETIYIDFDDTITLNDRVNPMIMEFLYQSRNLNKEIILISKSKKPIKKVLKRHAISEELFDEIIHLERREDKSDFILKKNAIFIDDSFSERRNVSKKNKIPTFDCSMLELLL